MAPSFRFLTFVRKERESGEALFIYNKTQNQHQNNVHWMESILNRSNDILSVYMLYWSYRFPFYSAYTISLFNAMISVHIVQCPCGIWRRWCVRMECAYIWRKKNKRKRENRIQTVPLGTQYVRSAEPCWKKDTAMHRHKFVFRQPNSHCHYFFNCFFALSLLLLLSFSSYQQ